MSMEDSICSTQDINSDKQETKLYAKAKKELEAIQNWNKTQEEVDADINRLTEEFKLLTREDAPNNEDITNQQAAYQELLETQKELANLQTQVATAKKAKAQQPKKIQDNSKTRNKKSLLIEELTKLEAEIQVIEAEKLLEIKRAKDRQADKAASKLKAEIELKEIKDENKELDEQIQATKRKITQVKAGKKEQKDFVNPKLKALMFEKDLQLVNRDVTRSQNRIQQLKKKQSTYVPMGELERLHKQQTVLKDKMKPFAGVDEINKKLKAENKRLVNATTLLKADSQLFVDDVDKITTKVRAEMGEAQLRLTGLEKEVTVVKYKLKEYHNEFPNHEEEKEQRKKDEKKKRDEKKKADKDSNKTSQQGEQVEEKSVDQLLREFNLENPIKAPPSLLENKQIQMAAAAIALLLFLAAIFFMK